jgi:hypothetical protein
LETKRATGETSIPLEQNVRPSIEALPAIETNRHSQEAKDGVTVEQLRMRTFDLRFAVLVAAATLIGCQGQQQPPNRAIVKGTVKFKGTLLKGGSVHIELAGDSVRQTDCIINEDGTFVADNVPVGDVLIAVETESLKFGGPPDSYVAIPRRYANVKTSDIKRTIQLGDNQIDIDLADK